MMLLFVSYVIGENRLISLYKYIFRRQTVVNRNIMFLCQNCFKNQRIYSTPKVLKVPSSSTFEFFTK